MNLKMICDLFPEDKKEFVQKCLSDDLLMEKVFSSASFVNALLRHFSEFRVEIMNIIAKSQKHVSRVVKDVFDLEIVLANAADFAKDVLKIISENEELFRLVFKNLDDVNRLKNKISLDLFEQVEQHLLSLNPSPPTKSV
jgi:hypothetical protein